MILLDSNVVSEATASAAGLQTSLGAQAAPLEHDRMRLPSAAINMLAKTKS
jgi:hypothetical protein